MATFSQSTVDKGSDTVIDFCCSPCRQHNADQWTEFYCDNCLKFYCGKCINLHGQLFGKHGIHGRGTQVSGQCRRGVEDFLQKCDLHEDKCLEMFCNYHSQRCCTNCVFLNHRQCAKVILIAESVKGPLPDLRQLSRKIQTILAKLIKRDNNWNTKMQSLQVSYNKQVHEIRQTRQKINTILNEIEETTLKELDDRMTILKASLKTDMDDWNKLKNELKLLSGAVQDVVDKGKAELSFIASKKGLEQIMQSQTYLKENSIQVESLLTFQPDIDFEQFFSKLSVLGRIVLGDPDQVFTVQRKSEFLVKIPTD